MEINTAQEQIKTEFFKLCKGQNKTVHSTYHSSFRLDDEGFYSFSEEKTEKLFEEFVKNIKLHF